MREWLIALSILAALFFGLSALFAFLPDEYEGLSYPTYVVALTALVVLRYRYERRGYW